MNHILLFTAFLVVACRLFTTDIPLCFAPFCSNGVFSFEKKGSNIKILFIALVILGLMYYSTGAVGGKTSKIILGSSTQISVALISSIVAIFSPRHCFP